MSANILKTIVDRIAVDLGNIDAPDGYNNTILSTNIKKQFESIDSAKSFPAIYIASARADRSRQTDQITYDVPVTVEVFGYVKKMSDTLEETMNLAADMEKAIYADETLDGNVWGLSLTFEVASMDEFGVVLMTLSATANYFKT